ncbi:MAG: hypothetical protein ITG07_02260 [Candidimonas sp.]|nr:hypothetical protein [Candidimonas sp.]
MEINRSLWESAKYVSWPYTHNSPIVRVPQPSGTPESRSMAPRPGETEDALFARCIEYRNARGVKVWGERRWAEMLQVQARSVARHREAPAGPQTGVYHYERPNTAPVWVAAWYELLADGTRRKRSKTFSYGTPRARYSTSEQAEAAAIERRNLEEARWYSTAGVREKRRVSPR